MRALSITIRDVIKSANYLDLPTLTQGADILAMMEAIRIQDWYPDIYIFWLGETPLYVGTSSDVSRRLEQHLGMCDSWGNRIPSFGRREPDTLLGQFIFYFASESPTWRIELRDSRDFIKETVEFEARVARWNAVKVESYLIFDLGPCFNSIHNRKPSAIPEPYNTQWQDYLLASTRGVGLSVYGG